MLIVQIISLSLSVVAVALLIFFRPRPNNNLFALNSKLDDLFKRFDLLTSHLRDDFKANREEASDAATQNRKELNETLLGFRREMTDTLRLITEQNKAGIDAVNKTLEDRLASLVTRLETNNKELRESVTNGLEGFSLVQRNKFDEWKLVQKEGSKQTTDALEKISSKVEEKLSALTETAKADAQAMRTTIETSFKGFNETFSQNMKDAAALQREKFGGLEDRQQKLVEATEKKLEGIRETVDEKLQKTLNERLGQSFSVVSTQLESVQKGLGEMQTLAQDVGGLKKVLSNVKMRGGFGEVQLHMLLENILAPEQYEANVATKKGSGERVEFAVKFPNKEGDREYVWLPIDAKFPKDAYENLQLAYDSADAASIEAAQKTLEGVIKKMAKDICDKYIDAPNTTNFGIMFLPFEGLFAEVVRKASLLEEVQRSCNVIITGPTTLAVILNSLQMGFRTLAIQKRSSEVWQVLSAVKKEFNSFGGMLEKAQNNIQTGLNQLDDVVGVRTRQIQRKLRGVELLEDKETSNALSPAEIIDDED
ncbi:MAG TPA: DNA recombination protein RmuC [Flavisolibacter sp.]|jgi:DNA recombination protein RmuC|nr:DNA recombination protein RmuC [Flavisolibacter sp.]